MSFQGRHGVRPAEREQPQDFKVDIEVEADLAAAGRTDRLADTVDYTAVRAAARDVIEGESMERLEAMASASGARVIAMTGVESVPVPVATLPCRIHPVDALAVRTSTSA